MTNNNNNDNKMLCLTSVTKAVVAQLMLDNSMAQILVWKSILPREKNQSILGIRLRLTNLNPRAKLKIRPWVVEVERAYDNPGLEISTRKLAKCEWFFEVASLKNIL